MSYRGIGGYRAGDFRAVRRRRGDVDLSDPLGVDVSDESSGLDLSGGGTPDFSDVTGGSSTVPASLDTLAAGFPLSLPDIGSGLSKFFGGGGLAAAAGSVAAAGAASSAASSVGKGVRKMVRRLMGHSGHRRMNPGNFHALRRSMRRLQAFERAARRVYHFTHPARHKSHFKFHRKRRR